MSPLKLTPEILLRPDTAHTKQELLGGKAGNLYKLSNAGFPVPQWFCLTTEAFEKAYQQLKAPIEKILQTLDTKELIQSEEASQRIEQLFLALELEMEGLSEQLTGGHIYAIRSSASGEDSSTHSFAGQLRSFLYIPSANVIEKIKYCWASAFTARAIQYLTVNQQPLDSLKVAVVIQQMIDSEKSGVMFTADPVKKIREELIIVAAYGVGEGVVADLAESDRFTLNKKNLAVLAQQIAHKKTMIKDGPRAVPTEMNDRPVLSPQEIQELAQKGKEIERLYQAPQDIEWAFDREGKLHILQTRPITNLDKKKIIIDNSNIVESFPGISSPMTWDVVGHVYATVFANCLKRLGMKKIPSQISGTLVHNYRGRIFYNLTSWYEMMFRFPCSGPYMKVWEEMIGTSLAPRSKRNLLFDLIRLVNPGLRLFLHFVFLDINLRKLDQQLKNYFLSFWRDHFKFEKMSKESLWEYYKKDFNTAIFKNWDITLLNDIYAFVFSSVLKKLLSSWISPAQGTKLFNELLCGISGVDSVAPLASLIKLAKIWKEEGESETFRQSFQKHIDHYGDRGVGELKLESITFRENEDELLKVVQEYASDQSTSMEQIENRENRIEGEAQKMLQAALHGKFLKRSIINLVLYLAKRSIIYRENFRLHRSRAYGIVRRICLLQGEKLYAEQKVDSVRDVFYLKMSELCSSEINFKEIVAQRKQEELQFASEAILGRYALEGDKAHPVGLTLSTESSILKGEPCSSGQIRAEVIVVNATPEIGNNINLVRNKILVAPMTDPGWVFLMTIAAGLIVEKGSILSHTAIIGRELGIPTIVGVANATQVLKTGDIVIMDAETGTIHKEEE